MAQQHGKTEADVPSDLRAVAEQIRAMPSDASDGLEARVFEASVSSLRDGRERPTLAGRIGPWRWAAPLAAAAAVGLLAWAGSSWLAPAPPATPDVAVAAAPLDEHVSDVLAYADLFDDSSWSTTVADEAEALEASWEPTIEAWSLDGEMEAG